MVQNDLQRKKDRERIQKEIEKLKDSIQTLTKAYAIFDFFLKLINFFSIALLNFQIDSVGSNTRVFTRRY